MSLREVDIAIRQIERRTHNDFAMSASLQGVQIPMMEVDRDLEVVFDEAKSAIAEKAMTEAMERKKREFHGK